MEVTILLAKVLGIYMFVAGVAVLFRRRQILLAIAEFVEDRSARLIAGLLALLGGLFLVNVHNDWSTLPAALVTLVGWIALVKGIAYLFLKEATLDGLVTFFHNRKWFFIDGAIAAIWGFYLAGFGYGWF